MLIGILTREQDFGSILKAGMSEKIRALRKTLESTGKGQTQVSSQQAYGKLPPPPRPPRVEIKGRRKLTGTHRLVPREEQKDPSSDHHDLLVPHRSHHYVERQEVPRTGNVSFPTLHLDRG